MQLAGVVAFAAAAFVAARSGGRASVLTTIAVLLVLAGGLVATLQTAAPIAARMGEPLVPLWLNYLLDTRSGQLAGLRMLVAGMIAGYLLAGLRWQTSNSSARPRVLFVATLMLVILLALDGHAQTAPGGSATMVAQVLHVGCGLLWAGLVLGLVVQLRANCGDRHKALRNAGMRAAIYAAIIAVSGPLLAWMHGVGPADLAASDYGRLVLLKSGLFLLALALAAGNRFHALRPHVAAQQPVLAMRLLWVEAGVVGGIILAAAALAHTPPVH